MFDSTALNAIDGLECRTVGSEVVVHDPVHEKVHVLNRSAAHILNLCDGRHSAEDIAETLRSRTGAPAERVRRDVETTLALFSDLQLVR